MMSSSPGCSASTICAPQLPFRRCGPRLLNLGRPASLLVAQPDHGRAAGVGCVDQLLNRAIDRAPGSAGKPNAIFQKIVKHIDNDPRRVLRIERRLDLLAMFERMDARLIRSYASSAVSCQLPVVCGQLQLTTDRTTTHFLPVLGSPRRALGSWFFRPFCSLFFVLCSSRRQTPASAYRRYPDR